MRRHSTLEYHGGERSMKVEVLASVMNASLPETVQHMNRNRTQ
ncbi:MAG: hypothetical protein ACLVGL_03995 [Waltera sp.]